MEKILSSLKSSKIRRNTPYFDIGMDISIPKIRGGQEVLCIPRVVTKDYSLTATVIKQAHTILGHYGAQKTANYICQWYWWPRLGHEVNKYCMMCGICQVNKTSTQ